MNNFYNKKTIIFATLISEGLLLLIWFIWHKTINQLINFNLDFRALYLSILFTLPLIILNFIIFTKARRPEFKKFINSYVLPLCDSLNLSMIIFVAIIAGVCEELFFRDFLLQFTKNYLGEFIAIIISSLAFSAIHFVNKIKEYFLIFVIYFFIGIYFALIVKFTNNITIAIITHSLYDFLAILLLKSSKIRRLICK